MPIPTNKADVPAFIDKMTGKNLELMSDIEGLRPGMEEKYLAPLKARLKAIIDEAELPFETFLNTVNASKGIEDLEDVLGDRIYAKIKESKDAMMSLLTMTALVSQRLREITRQATFPAPVSDDKEFKNVKQPAQNPSAGKNESKNSAPLEKLNTDALELLQDVFNLSEGAVPATQYSALKDKLSAICKAAEIPFDTLMNSDVEARIEGDKLKSFLGDAAYEKIKSLPEQLKQMRDLIKLTATIRQELARIALTSKPTDDKESKRDDVLSGLSKLFGNGNGPTQPASGMNGASPVLFPETSQKDVMIFFDIHVSLWKKLH